jgi:hypothetical protein
MKTGEKIRHFIEKEIYRHGYIDWLEDRGLEMDDVERFLDAGESALDGEESEGQGDSK